MREPKTRHLSLNVRDLDRPQLYLLANKLDAFARAHDSADNSAPPHRRKEYRSVHAAGMTSRAEIDPVLTQWVKLAALACQKLAAANTICGSNHMEASILTSPVPNRFGFGPTNDANRLLVLSDLSDTDIMALEALERLSKLRPISKTLTHYLYPSDKEEKEPVTPSRAAQIDDFAELMAEVRQNSVMQDVFRRVSRLMQRSQGPQR